MKTWGGKLGEKRDGEKKKNDVPREKKERKEEQGRLNDNEVAGK